MRINDETLLKELRKNKDKSKRANNYKIKAIITEVGKKSELTISQGYNASNDIYNPFFVRVYDENGSQVHSGVGATIEQSYNSLLASLIFYKNKAEKARNEANTKLFKIYNIIAPEEDDYDDRF